MAVRGWWEWSATVITRGGQSRCRAWGQSPGGYRRVLALKPDLLVVWLHGNAERQLEPLRRLGVPLFYSEPTKLEAIPETLLNWAR